MSIRSRLVYAGRHFMPTWRYVFNLRSTLDYRKDRNDLPVEGERIVESLNRDGIAISSVERLTGLENIFLELRQSVDGLEAAHAAQLAEARSQADSDEIGRKTFLLQLLGEHPALDPESVFARLALHPQILRIANEYFGMYTQIRYYNIWHTVITRGEPRESQLWHKDREDHLILKLFVYLSDIDDGAGPFTYAPGTHYKGSTRARPQTFNENGVERWRDEEMAKIVPASQWIKATGPIGTFAFADTRGCHKGGLARDKDRLIYVCLFTSPTSQAPELFIRPKTIPLLEGKAQRLAIAPPARGIFA